MVKLGKNIYYYCGHKHVYMWSPFQESVSNILLSFKQVPPTSAGNWDSVSKEERSPSIVSACLFMHATIAYLSHLFSKSYNILKWVWENEKVQIHSSLSKTNGHVQPAIRFWYEDNPSAGNKMWPSLCFQLSNISTMPDFKLVNKKIRDTENNY